MKTEFVPFPFDQERDESLLIACGYTREFVPDDWEDVGGPESGPHLVGHPDMDIYTCGNHEIVVIDGMVVAAEFVPQPPPGWFGEEA